GGFLLAGDTYSFGAGSQDGWLVKTDVNGKIQWNQTYGGWAGDEINALIQTDDGGYAFSGSTSSFGRGNNDMWLVKTDISGQVQWNQTFGGNDSDWAIGVIHMEDGSFALAGCTQSFGAGEYDMWLVKTDELKSIDNGDTSKTSGISSNGQISPGWGILSLVILLLLEPIWRKRKKS
ncbi:MAG: hypothetical protein ACFFE8_11700, partial [Candidatus Heimdallarchaeota archaeon]